MKRQQFYPGTVLDKKLTDEAKRLGVSVSSLIVDILNEHYGLQPKNTLPFTQVTANVLAEVQAFIAKHKPGTEFDLLTASPTFETIEMVCKGKPSANRARIGKIFSPMAGTAPFANVQAVRKPDGNVKKSVNKATIYVIV